MPSSCPGIEGHSDASSAITINRRCSYWLHVLLRRHAADSEDAIQSLNSHTSELKTGSERVGGIMRRALFKSTLFEIILLSFTLAAMSVAEAVNIPVSGIVNADCNPDLPCFTLTGPGFSLMHRQSSQTTGNQAGIPGQEIRLNARPIVDGNSILTFQGINYLPGMVSSVPGPLFNRFGDLPVSTPPVRFPENPPQRVQLVSPAVLSASLVGQNPVTNELETFNLSGFGSATAVFVPCSQCSTPGIYNMQQISYEFTAVPEPSAGLLLATGFAALLFFRKR